MTDEKYKHQKKYSERNKEKIALYCKQRYLNQYMDEILQIPVIQEYIKDPILEEATDWYLKLDTTRIRGYKVTVKFKTIVYMVAVYKYRMPLFYQEFQITPPVKRTQGLKEKLVEEYKQIYGTELRILPLHPMEYLPRFTDIFKLPEEMVLGATQVISKSREKFKYTNPKTYIGSVIYHVARGYITQKQLADFLMITPNGIRGIHRKLKAFLGES